MEVWTRGIEAVSLATVNLGALERRSAKNHQRAAPASTASSLAVSKTRVSGQTLGKGCCKSELF